MLVFSSAQKLTLPSAVKEIRSVIKTLTAGTPAEQERAVKNHFLPDAGFTHPFCSVPSFQPYTIPFTSFTIDSRWVILMVYRWYRILSPHIETDIQSVGMSTLYLPLQLGPN